MDALNMREPRQRVCVEGEQRSRQQPRRIVTRPLPDEQIAGERGQREAEKQDDVEREDRRAAHPPHGHAENRRNDQGLREGQRVLRGIEDVGVEQPCGRVRQLVRNPGKNPFVQQRVAVVVAAQRSGFRDERPRVDDCEDHADDRRQQGAVTGGDRGMRFQRAARLRISVSSMSIGDGVVAALRDDDVGVALARLDELEVHRLDGAEVLVDHRLHRAAALGDVALQPADEARVVVGVDEHLDVHQRAQRRVGEDQDALDDDRAARRRPVSVVVRRT